MGHSEPLVVKEHKRLADCPPDLLGEPLQVCSTGRQHRMHIMHSAIRYRATKVCLSDDDLVGDRQRTIWNWPVTDSTLANGPTHYMPNDAPREERSLVMPVVSHLWAALTRSRGAAWPAGAAGGWLQQTWRNWPWRARRIPGTSSEPARMHPLH